MRDFIRKNIRKIIYDEYNHIIIDSENYLKFEDFLIESIFKENYLEEGFNTDIIISLIKKNIDF